MANSCEDRCAYYLQTSTGYITHGRTYRQFWPRPSFKRRISAPDHGIENRASHNAFQGKHPCHPSPGTPGSFSDKTDTGFRSGTIPAARTGHCRLSTVPCSKTKPPHFLTVDIALSIVMQDGFIHIT